MSVPFLSEGWDVTTGIWGGLSPLIAQYMPAAKQHREILERDVSRMERGKLGLSDAKKRQMMMQSLGAAQAQQSNQSSEMQRVLASGQNSSAVQSALQNQLAQNPQLAAQIMAQLNAQSAQLAQQRKEEILKRLERQYDRISGAMQQTVTNLQETGKSLSGSSGGGGGGGGMDTGTISSVAGAF